MQKIQSRQQELEESRQFQVAQAQQLQRQAQEYQQRMGPARATKEGFTAPDYRKYSGQFFQDAQRQKQEGDLEASNNSLANAYKAIATAEQLEAYEHQKQNEGLAQHYQGTFIQDMDRVCKEHPEAHPNSGEPITQDIDVILKTCDFLRWVPKGFQFAYEAAVLRRGAIEGLEAKKERDELRKQLGITNAKLEPSRGHATAQRGERDFKDMSYAERERHLEEQANELDMQGVPATGHGFQ